jgi:hypothetical protein
LVGALGLNGLVLALAVASLGNAQVPKAATTVGSSFPATEQVSGSAEVAVSEFVVQPITEEQAEPTTAANPTASESGVSDSQPIADTIAEPKSADTQTVPLAVDRSEVAPSEPCRNPTGEEAAGEAPEFPDRTPATAAPTLPADVLIVINGQHTGGEVHFDIDGELYCLQPGEYLQLPGEVARTVAFHRGGDFGDEQRELNEGAYVFRVGDAGWQLADLPAAAAAALLQESRPQDAAK